MQAFGVLQGIFIIVASGDGLGKVGELVSKAGTVGIDKVCEQHCNSAQRPRSDENR